MATIGPTDISTLARKVMTGHAGVTVLVAKWEATSDSAAGTYLVKDPKAGDSPVTTANAAPNAKGGPASGDGLSWKPFSHSDLVTAYSIT